MIRPDGSLTLTVAGNIAVNLAAQRNQPRRKISAGGDALPRRLQILPGNSADLFIRQLPPGKLLRAFVQNLVRTGALGQRRARRKGFRRYGCFPRSGREYFLMGGPSYVLWFRLFVRRRARRHHRKKRYRYMISQPHRRGNTLWLYSAEKSVSPAVLPPGGRVIRFKQR